MKKYIFLFIPLVIIGCRNEQEAGDEVSQSLKPDQKFEYSVKFPDTVYVNESNDGEIFYKTPLDTIVEKFFDPKQNRYVVLRTLSDSLYTFHSDQYSDSLKEYRIGAIDNRSLPFYDLSFKTTGTFEINGLINDLVLREPKTKNNSNENKVRLIEEDFPLSFRIVVIERNDN